MTNSKTATTSTENIDQANTTLKKGGLGTWSLIFFVISATAPLTSLTGMFPLGVMYGNGLGFPVAYLLAMFVLLAFSVGYTSMIRYVKNAGAFYALVTRGLNGQVGGAVAVVMLVAYNSGQIAMQGLFGVASAGFMQTYFGVDLPWWAYSFFAIAAIGFLGYRKVDFSLMVLGVLVLGEFLIVVMINAGIISSVGTNYSFSAFETESVLSGSMSLALLMAMGSFLGFEATALYSEETKNPAKTIPRATYLSLLIIGIFYCISGLSIVNGMGIDKVLTVFPSLADPTQYIYQLADQYVSSNFSIYVRFLLITSTFASLLAFHNAAARYFFVLGREGILHKSVGVTHRDHMSPHIGSVLQSVIAIAVVSVFAIGQLDPMATLFAWLGSIGILGIIAMTSVVSIAVIVFFLRNSELGVSFVKAILFPVISAVLLAFISFSIAVNFSMFSGATGFIGIALPSLIPIAAVVGWVRATRLKKTNLPKYNEMGSNKY
ncbi:amino acid transporter [Pseudomonas sp. 2725]|uniref:APC family permease n=1 Tax=Pseudomonas sp. 2725 TaxID=3156449 RepID=UPI003D19107A